MYTFNIPFLIKCFKDKCGEPDSEKHLIKYLTFLINYKSKYNSYSENHHILPRAIFEEYIKDKRNIIKLLYSDHIKAHEILVYAYTTRQNLRTLNFMTNDTIKNSELLSIAAKKGWVNFKKDHNAYLKWKRDRSNYMKTLSSVEQRRRVNIFWDNLNEIEYNKICLINKNNWTDELKRKKSKQMSEYFKNNPSEATRRNKIRWNNISDSEKQAFKDKMNNVNNDLQKKQKASVAIKKKWRDPEFKQKMSNRKTSKRLVVAIDPNGNIIERYGLTKMIEEFDFSPYLVRLFNNTNKQVVSINTKNKQVLNTIGWIFKYKKYKH